MKPKRKDETFDYAGRHENGSYFEEVSVQSRPDGFSVLMRHEYKLLALPLLVLDWAILTASGPVAYLWLVDTLDSEPWWGRFVWISALFIMWTCVFALPKPVTGPRYIIDLLIHNAFMIGIPVLNFLWTKNIADDAVVWHASLEYGALAIGLAVAVTRIAAKLVCGHDRGRLRHGLGVYAVATLVVISSITIPMAFLEMHAIAVADGWLEIIVRYASMACMSWPFFMALRKNSVV